MRTWSLRMAIFSLIAAIVLVGSAIAKPKSTDKPLFASMSGKNEISATGKKRAGDLDGLGSFSAVVHQATNELCYGLTVQGISAPAAAHIHKAKRNKNGPIVIPLTPPSAGDPGTSSGCVNADSDLLRDIRKHPSRYYANVHTTDFPGGAVRGQLFKRGPR
jgi:hypothetical protein